MITFILLGIFVGAILTSGSNSEYLEVPNVILQGLATGTLLYVIFFEVLSKDRSGILPYISVFFGFFFMTLLQYFGECKLKKYRRLVRIWLRMYRRKNVFFFVSTFHFM